MVKELYSVGCFTFESAKDLADFKINYPTEWHKVSRFPLRKSTLKVDDLQDFVDYIDSLQTLPDICLAYQSDRARGHGYYTTVWCNGLEIRGIFGYLTSDDISDHLVFEMITLSTWKGLEVRQNKCR